MPGRRSIGIFSLPMLSFTALPVVAALFAGARPAVRPRAASIVASESSLSAPPTLLPRSHSPPWSWRGHAINHRVEGSGPPILLVHGFGASVNHWRDNIPALVAAGYRVHAIDLLGLGGSDKPDLPEEPQDGTGPGEGYCMELWANQTADYISAFAQPGDEPWVVAGNSIGGLTSLLVAAELGPEKVT